MTAYNRYLSGEMNTVVAPVKGSVVIEAGDFLFINETGGALGLAIAADNYAYPLFGDIFHIHRPLSFYPEFFEFQLS